MGIDLHEATLAQMRAAMERGESSSSAIVGDYLSAIEEIDGDLGSIIETNAAAMEMAETLDRERADGRVRGPLHGIPILLKDNIDTDDAMQTTAGSLALLGSRPGGDATVASRLRAAGAVILGKANLSEWANIRSTHSTSGWSARGGQCRNPYDLSRNPCGSSSGSGAAVSANLAAAALGTETDGSIVCPSSLCGVVGIKPTVGLTSRAGVIPISSSQDTVGPMARTVADAAAILGAIAGPDPRDGATAAGGKHVHNDYTQFLQKDGLRGARIGLPRARYFGLHEETDRAIEPAIEAMREAGAILIDPVEIPHSEDERIGESERIILLTELKATIAKYLATRVPIQPGASLPLTLADLIEFNQINASDELVHFGQELFEQALTMGNLESKRYREARAVGPRLAGVEGLDAVMDAHDLDVLIAPTAGPAWPIDYARGDTYHGGSSQHAALAGYPLISVPAAFVEGLPVGLTFMGRAWSEPTLIRLAYAFEQLTGVRRAPTVG